MKQYFEKQIENNPTITEEILEKLHAKADDFNDPYQVGDKVVYFIEEVVTRKSDIKKEISLYMVQIRAANIDRLAEKYEFFRWATDAIPCFVKKAGA